MKITLRDEQLALEISDDQLDADAFVELTLIGGGDTVTGAFLVEELLASCIAFDAKRSRRLSEESNQHD